MDPTESQPRLQTRPDGASAPGARGLHAPSLPGLRESGLGACGCCRCPARNSKRQMGEGGGGWWVEDGEREMGGAIGGKGSVHEFCLIALGKP
eukprot:2613891-Rhodomonas_salina.2